MKRTAGTRKMSDRRLRLEHRRHPGNILMAGLKISSEEVLGIDLFRKSMVRTRIAGSNYDVYGQDDHRGQLSAPTEAELDIPEHTAERLAGGKIRQPSDRLQVLSPYATWRTIRRRLYIS